MKKLAIILLCIGVLIQCKKKEDAQPEPEPPSTGSIKGKVTQFDQFGSTYSVGLNSLTVSVVGTNYSTVTDASGNYRLDYIPAGIYTLAFDKSGCRQYQVQQVNFPGDGEMYKNISISDYSTITFNSASIKDTIYMSTKRLKITINLNPISKEIGYAVIFSQIGTPDIFDAATFSNIIVSFPFGVLPNQSSHTTYYPSSLSAGTYYAKIYPYVKNSSIDVTRYYDYASSKYIYIGHGTPIPTVYTVTIQ